MSDIEFQQKQIDVSAAQQNVEDQRQGLLQLHTAMDTAKDELNHLIVQGKSRKAELDRQLQVLKQQQDELAGQEKIYTEGSSIRDYRCCTDQTGAVCESIRTGHDSHSR